MTGVQSWRRYVALGDSFTEGIGDPDPARPGGYRGWADRVADVLAAHEHGDFSYANLAIRGRLAQQIVDEQIDPALALHPDLVSIAAGGNDVIRPGSDPDRVAAYVEPAIARLRSEGATVVMFTGVDVGWSPVFRTIRGKVAIYNENLRTIAARHGCLVADQWGFTPIHDPDLWAEDRLHLNAYGHQKIARLVLDVLGVPNDLEPGHPEPRPPVSWRRARANDLYWAREYALPWVKRRLRKQSSGDDVQPKRPDFSLPDPIDAPPTGGGLV